jgi:hypothetical protein
MNNNEFELEKQLVILSTPTINKLLSLDKAGVDALTLYVFYYHTAKWQETNQPKATPNYCMKGLKWGEDRFKRADKILRDLQLVEKVIQRDKKGKITGWFVRLNYIWTTNKVNEMYPEGVETRRVEKPPGGYQGINALSVNNINALSVNTNIVGDTSNTGSNKENTNKEEPFNSESYIQSLINSPQRHLQVIGIYWNYKHYKFENKKQAEKALKRDLRPATDLAPYSNAKIFQTMDYLDEYADYKWTLETVFKYIDEDIDELIAKEEAKIREKHRPY